MAHTPAWRNFRRMQDVTVAAGLLIYAGAVLYAFQQLPGGPAMIAQRTLAWPAMFLVPSFALPLLVKGLRRGLSRYVWMSYQAGFGQTAGSVIIGVGLLAGAALFVYWQVAAAHAGGPYPAAVFASYGAGIGILGAQAVLVRSLEREPEVRPLIEEPDAF